MNGPAELAEAYLRALGYNRNIPDALTGVPSFSSEITVFFDVGLVVRISPTSRTLILLQCPIL